MPEDLDLDVVIVGAGVTGLHLLHRLRSLNLRVRALEAGGGVGGTWYWNRYPGARFDSESYSYGYSFDKEILDEWEWAEHYAAQPETERYLNYVADKLDLRSDITLNARVTAAKFDEVSDSWQILTEDGATTTCRFLCTAVGPLSVPYMPHDVTGIDEFQGDLHHTGLWPSEPVNFVGKRVAVIGNGATGIQVVTEIAKSADRLTVFQRTANYALPLRNRRITPEEQTRIKATYDEIFRLCRSSPGGFIHHFDSKLGADHSRGERLARYEELWDLEGFAKWSTGYPDVMSDAELNAEYSDFVRAKIRERIDDPGLADKLIPTFPFGTRRVPLESGYWEVYNQPNVDVRFVNETPIEAVEAAGIRIAGEVLPFDIIVFATGFDAFTGAFDRIDFRGIGGESLREHWSEGPRSYLGLQVAGFPNLFTLVGPHNKGAFCNIPRCSEQNVDWVTDCIAHVVDSGRTRIETSRDAEDEWLAHIESGFSKMLLSKVLTRSFWIGTNIPGKKHMFYGYPGPFPEYQAMCDSVTRDGYRGFTLSGSSGLRRLRIGT